MMWPWVSRATLEAAEARIASLEAERRKLIDALMTAHGQPPLYEEPRHAAPAPLPQQPAAEPARPPRTRATFELIEAMADEAAQKGELRLKN